MIFDRNFLRHKIIPQLITRRQGVVKNIARSATLIAEATQLNRVLAEIDYQSVCGDLNETLDIAKLNLLSDSRQGNVIRYWFTLLNVRLPSQAVLKQIKQQFLCNNLDAKPVVAWGDVVLQRIKKAGSYYLVTKCAPSSAISV